MSDTTDKTFLGNPCRRQHQNEQGECLRYTCNGACVQCTTENSVRRRTKQKQQAIAEAPTPAEATQ